MHKFEVENIFCIKGIQMFYFSLFIIPVPIEIEVHTVPHFKAPLNAKIEPGRLECGDTFT